jgi:hypothetical protein
MSDTFDTVELNEDQLENTVEISESFRIVEQIIKLRVPPGRYQSLALTNLEIAGMFAVKGASHGAV